MELRPKLGEAAKHKCQTHHEVSLLGGSLPDDAIKGEITQFLCSPRLLWELSRCAIETRPNRNQSTVIIQLLKSLLRSHSDVCGSVMPAAVDDAAVHPALWSNGPHHPPRRATEPHDKAAACCCGCKSLSIIHSWR